MPAATMVLPTKSGIRIRTAYGEAKKYRADESEYLLSSRANREHLNNAVNNIERGESLVTFDNIGDAMLFAEKHVAERLATT